MKKYFAVICLIGTLSAACAGVKSPPPAPSPPSPALAETLKEYVEAARTRDVAKLRQTASKKTIQMMEEMLVEEGSSLEEAIQKNEPSIPPIFENPEILGEKIQGDKATLEVKNRFTGASIAVPFVKEEGRWKLAVGEQMDEMIDKFDRTNQELENTNKKLSEEPTNR
jgi:hypothetical protein